MDFWHPHKESKRSGLCKNFPYNIGMRGLSRRPYTAQSGFSLAQILVAAGFLGFLSLVFSQMINNAQKAQKGVQNSVDFDILKGSIQNILNNKSLCDVAFRSADNLQAASFSNSAGPYPASDASLQPVGLLRLGNSSPPVVVAQTGLELGGGLRVASVSLRQLGAQQASGTGFSYPVTLEVVAEKKTGGFGGETLRSKSQIFVIQTNATGSIMGCGGSGGSSAPRPLDSARPWIKDKILCRTSAGNLSVFNFAGESLAGVGGRLLYVSPHGDVPLSIAYDPTSGAYISYGGGNVAVATSCIGAGKSLQTIANDADNIDR